MGNKLHIADATQRALAKRRTSQSSQVSLELYIGLWDSKEPAAHYSTTARKGVQTSKTMATVCRRQVFGNR